MSRAAWHALDPDPRAGLQRECARRLRQQANLAAKAHRGREVELDRAAAVAVTDGDVATIMEAIDRVWWGELK